MERIGAVVPAGGRSARMGGVDKLFVSLSGRPLLAWCVEALEAHDLVVEIVVAVAPERIADARRIASARGWAKTRLVEGGVRRQDSVAHGLAALGEVDWVVVHDGDRPFLDARLIADGLHAARSTGVAVASVPVTDTVKRIGTDGVVVATLDRGMLRAVQTPQVFRADIIRRAYADVDETVTDDAVLAERLGYAVRLYDGAYDNVKVTMPDDLAIAEVIARRRGTET